MALAGLTAMSAVEDTIKLKPGETILIQGGAGGVASFAIQLGKHIGARVISTASAANLDYVRGLGADQVIDYRPLKLAPEDADVVVKSVIRQAGGEPISVDYSMKKTDSGWKVYDVQFAGMSLVMNYRSTFTAEIQRSGVAGLIKALAEKNKALTGKGRVSVRT